MAVASPNLDQELFCACRGERSNARIPKPLSTGVEKVASPYWVLSTTGIAQKRTTKWPAKYYTHEKSYYPVPTYFHAFVSVLSNVSPSATNCDRRRWTCDLHAAWRFWSGAQTSQGEREQSSEVEIRNCIDNFCPVWQRTVRSETTQDKARSLSPCQLSNISQSVKKNIYYAVSILQYSQDSCGRAGLNKRDSVIAKLSTEVRRQVEFQLNEYLSLLPFAKGKQGL